MRGVGRGKIWDWKMSCTAPSAPEKWQEAESVFFKKGEEPAVFASKSTFHDIENGRSFQILRNMNGKD